MYFAALMILLIFARSVFTFPLALERRFSGGGLNLGSFGDGYISGWEYGPFVQPSFLYTVIPLAYGTKAYTPYLYDSYGRRYFTGRFAGNKPKEDLSQGLIGGLIGGLIIGKSSGGEYVGLNVDGHRIGVGLGIKSGIELRVGEQK